MSRALPTALAPGLGQSPLLDRPGAFEWWYLDLVDEHGDGVVLIASFGLPMLPLGLAERRRTPPRDLPALAFSVYRGGRPHHWALQTFAPDEASLDGAVRRLGPHTVELRVEGDRVRWAARLDGTTGGAAFAGRVEAEGALRRARPDDPAAAPHGWSLLSPCARGEADLRVEGEALRIAGSAYVDRNEGEAPLADLGVATWHWGRVTFAEGALVWYAAEGDGAASRTWWVSSEGAVTELPTPPAARGTRWNRYLLAHPAFVDVALPDGTLAVPFDTVVEDGPFYRRFLVRVTAGPWGPGLGYAEFAQQRAMDTSSLLPLVRMAVDRGAASSPWLPLLVGPPATRWSRFVRGRA